MSHVSLNELAATLDTTPERLQTLVRQTLDRVQRSQYYVFRITGEQKAQRAEPAQPRLIAAFPSPDDALSFAQRNGYGSNAQLRPVATADLIIRMLADPTIGTVLFLSENVGETTRGFGPGLKITRGELIEQLATGQPPEAPAAIELTAKQYDALQFGVNFQRRAEFRAALTQAIEQVVAAYQPPAGSLDHGPRSIYATSAVEEWLKRNGFPHAHQRQWIDVAGDPRWGGAVELCEIDGGTRNHLLVQLVIHVDETGRQFIKWVNVTV
ncbi:MAG TPA: hypothetical protein VFZ66_16880 [Herpetosiphonaceae bacterium]